MTSALAKMDPVEEEEKEAAPAGPAGRADPEHERTMSWRQVLKFILGAPDSYVLLLILLVVNYVTLTTNWTGSVAFVTRSVLFSFTMLLAFHTSRVHRWIMNAAWVVVILSVLVAIGVAIGGGTEADADDILFMSILVFASGVAIGWRILHHGKVTGETIAGAVCIYVLIGMTFAIFDYGWQLASGTPFFLQAGHHTLPDFAYFSYITMATVGFGDLAPATGLPRTLTVLDALMGQIFLVVLLARLVALYHGPVGWRDELYERIQEVSDRIREDPQSSGPGSGPKEG